MKKKTLVNLHLIKRCPFAALRGLKPYFPAIFSAFTRFFSLPIKHSESSEAFREKWLSIKTSCFDW